MSDPSDSRPEADEEILVSLPESSLDDLIAGLEATWQTTPEPDVTAGPDVDAEERAATGGEPIVPEEMGAPVAAAPMTPAPSTPDEAPPSGGPERRGAIRHEANEFKSDLRLAVAGFPMRLVNLSRTGLLAETNQRLCPGRTVDVFLRYGGVRTVLRATVIRSSMHAVAPTPIFRAALQFEDELALQDTEL